MRFNTFVLILTFFALSSILYLKFNFYNFKVFLKGFKIIKSEKSKTIQCYIQDKLTPPENCTENHVCVVSIF